MCSRSWMNPAPSAACCNAARWELSRGNRARRKTRNAMTAWRMSKRRQDGNLRDVTESDNCVPDFTSARFFCCQNFFFVRDRIGISHETSFFTQLICKLFMAGSAKAHHKCLLRPAPVGNAILCLRSAARTKENAVLQAPDRKKTKQNPKYSVQGMSLSVPLSVNSKIYTASQGVSAYADFDCGRP